MVSDSAMRNRENGQFNNYSAVVTVPVRVVFLDINATRPGQIQVFDDSNREVDIYDIRNYRATTASESNYDITDKYESANLNVRRALNFLPVPAARKSAERDGSKRNDTRADSPAYTFNGPDG